MPTPMTRRMLQANTSSRRPYVPPATDNQRLYAPKQNPAAPPATAAPQALAPTSRRPYLDNKFNAMGRQAGAMGDMYNLMAGDGVIPRDLRGEIDKGMRRDMAVALGQESPNVATMGGTKPYGNIPDVPLEEIPDTAMDSTGKIPLKSLQGQQLQDEMRMWMERNPDFAKSWIASKRRIGMFDRNLTPRGIPNQEPFVDPSPNRKRP